MEESPEDIHTQVILLSHKWVEEDLRNHPEKKAEIRAVFDLCILNIFLGGYLPKFFSLPVDVAFLG
jgi:hypothetical protein